jgi:hypothetical protein
MTPWSPRPSSPNLGVSRSGSPTAAPLTHIRTTPPPPCTQRERTTPSSPSCVRVNSAIQMSLPLSRRVYTRSSSQRTTPLSPRSEENRGSLPRPHQPVRLPPAPFRAGYSPGAKPKAADYDDGVDKMLLNAMHEYACLILTRDAFPDDVKQTQWAEATWQSACEETGVYYECSVRMTRLVSLQHYCHTRAEC